MKRLAATERASVTASERDGLPSANFSLHLDTSVFEDTLVDHLWGDGDSSSADACAPEFVAMWARVHLDSLWPIARQWLGDELSPDLEQAITELAGLCQRNSPGSEVIFVVS